jgi:hypothetical protein
MNHDDERDFAEEQANDKLLHDESELLESCGCCGADLGPSTTYPWHYEDEDCRAIRKPRS